MSEGDLMWPEDQHSTENLNMEAVDKSQLLDNEQDVPDTLEANEQSEEGHESQDSQQTTVSRDTLCHEEDSSSHGRSSHGGAMEDLVLTFPYTSIEQSWSESPHPAETSGPSSKPELQLLGMPKEVRDIIWKLVVTKMTSIKVCFSMLSEDDPDYDRGYGTLRKGYGVGLTFPGRYPMSLLYVCHQTYNEVIPFLYGENHFVSFNVRGFNGGFVNDPDHGIGRANAALIKRASFGLVHLELSVKFENYYVSPATQDQHIEWSQERRALLLAAAHLTQRHPNLKKAVWCATSGGALATFWHGTKMQVRFAVFLLPAGQNVNITRPNSRLDIEARTIVTDDIVLDCPNIRGTAWDDLLNKQATDFALDKDAKASEPPAHVNV
ncbi:hypothetical protein LTR47_005828 [Exophiala xenobiotica]|nr:hypothetical protein LTR47_005828 [Exophiala xenobiotica]KAK5258949.1 hypothetical protein LTR40_006882 [Exophiala xenobiotica]KAK5350994.1 hypothetical protein LTR61_005347 [Exophiala xenobiotica]KAK5373974.1 hypothetical protein LTS03_006129 [Exophiala xenobiotica]KAK5374417.1 hypothetical protein LTR11_005624 [Exophiala xenobiotica]